uniref:Uncharacterized protein n=1 Tax=Anguilla anguilla TaxID=7936 RepID=A0A0E9T9H2_ANGAN
MIRKPFGIICYDLKLDDIGPIMSGFKANTEFHSMSIIPTVKKGGGSVMVWGCFAAS